MSHRTTLMTQLFAELMQQCNLEKVPNIDAGWHEILLDDGIISEIDWVWVPS